MTPLEPWERVYVKDDFLESVHGQLGCITCHSGDETATDKHDAHVGIIAYPSEDAETYCGTCHADEVETYVNSLHKTQDGYFERFSLRAGYDLHDPGHEQQLEGFNTECAKCHASCGQCHVIRPISVNGGLNWGHEFRKTPDLKTNCTACHGSRIGEEYTGEHKGIKPDVHYIPNAKRCDFCHTSHEMHGGDGTPLTYRYDENNSAMPKCENCHAGTEQNNDYHKQHWAGDSGVTLACQVCHAQSYKNCNGCHTGGEGITGSSYLTFEIGKNYLKDNQRYQDYDYITVRHIPITPDTYASWGESNLENFDESEPTWKLATPHNIQRWTPQTQVTEGETCSASCHNSDYYLRAEDIDQYKDANYNEESGESGYGYDALDKERKANQDVIIP